MPDDEPAARLNDATARLIGRPVAPDDRFGIAVSGGPDSMALLDLAACAWPGQVEAATVDHGLRPEAAEEAALVARFCAARDIPHSILTPAAPIAGSLQMQARAARYALLEAWRTGRGLDWLLTAHHADDQIETVLMRLNRGAGLTGLRGVRHRRGAILRPLLGMRRAELRDWCAGRGIPFVDDPSNADPRFDRARLRQAIGAAELVDPAGLARSVAALGDADDALGWAAARLLAERVREEGGLWTLDAADLPGHFRRRLLEEMLRRANPAAKIPRGPAMDQALVQLLAGRTLALADCMVAGGPVWTVRRARPRRSV